jgi:hypothetical protein
MQEAAKKREMRYSDLKKIDRGVRRHFHDDITVVVVFMPWAKLAGAKAPRFLFEGAVSPFLRSPSHLSQLRHGWRAPTEAAATLERKSTVQVCRRDEKRTAIKCSVTLAPAVLLLFAKLLSWL